MKKPHIIIFNPDQWRADVLGHNGNSAAVTPNLDRMAREDGVSFTNAFCQNTVCTPSRCSFMSGTYPHTRGHRTMHHMLRPDEACLLKQLKDDGYFVWWGGKNDLIPGQDGYEDYCDVKDTSSRTTGFSTHRDDTWRGAPDGDNYFSFYVNELKPTEPDGRHYDGDWAALEAAIELIRNPPTDKPLCIYLPLQYPHPPYAAEENWKDLIDMTKLPTRAPTPEGWRGKPSLLRGIWEKQKLQGWTEDRWDKLRATYYAMCARVDHQFNLLMDAMREAGIYDDSAVFLFSDHGDFTGDYGLVEKTQNTFEDCLTNVPFIVKPPKDVPIQPRVSDALVELIDFTATVYELSGIESEHTHFGKSLLPLIAGEADMHRDAVFCEGGRLKGEVHCSEANVLPDEPESLIYWPRLAWQAQDGPEHTKAVMCRTKEFKYVRRLYESDEFYDLRADPQELDNRINDPAYASQIMAHKERMLTFFMETGDIVPHEPDRRW
jgi:arylsulfatase A-like enzyme